MLVSYDAECPFCSSVADWAREGDSGGRLVFFPIQNPELLRMAPELGGLPLHEYIHGINASTRQVYSDGDLWLRMLACLPAWKLCAWLLSLPGLSGVAQAMYRRRRAAQCRGRAHWRG